MNWWSKRKLKIPFPMYAKTRMLPKTPDKTVTKLVIISCPALFFGAYSLRKYTKALDKIF
jgi:hypothetical protein